MRLALTVLLCVAAAPVAASDRAGQDVVENVCATCHASGRDGAPKIGDAKAWEPRMRRGLTGLTGRPRWRACARCPGTAGASA